MRRRHREVRDRERIDEILAAVEHGCLSFIAADGWPTLRPLNFVHHRDGEGDHLYFHGATRGEKMESFAGDDRATFVVVKDYSLVPSYFQDAERACPATQFFESVMARGRMRVVTGVAEKATALQALMEKLQPEGGHVPITADDPRYTADLQATAVLSLDVEAMVAKENLATDRPAAKTARITAGLEARDAPRDRETLAAMARSAARSATRSATQRAGCPALGEDRS